MESRITRVHHPETDTIMWRITLTRLDSERMSWRAHRKFEQGLEMITQAYKEAFGDG